MTKELAPRTITLGGNPYYLKIDEWLAESIQEAELDRVAVRLDLELTGLDVVRRIVDYVKANGPVLGIEVVKRAFDDQGDGKVRINWTLFFKYACKHYGMLRFKKDPAVPNSGVAFAFADQTINR